MRTPTALLFVLLASAPANAQCFGPWCAPRAGVRFSVWVGPVYPPVYGYGYSATYWNAWVAPPVLAVPVPVEFSLADHPQVLDGVDLAALRKKLAREREDSDAAERVAKGRVEAAVKNGGLVVFEPGQPVPKRPDLLAKQPDPRKPVPAALPPADPAGLARFHLRRGQEAFDAGELGRATERLALAVAADPTLGVAHFTLAQVRLARGQYAEAVDAIRAGMKQVANWPDARFQPSDLYALNPKRLAADAADLKAALDAAPTDGTLAFLYAHHLWFGGDRAAATDLFRKLKDKVNEPGLIEPFLKK